MQRTNQSGETQQPSEDGRVTISRAAGSLTFPARFMLIAAMNPCPCGYWGNSGEIGGHMCRCSVREIEKYRQRISGPLLDRIDLHVEVPAVSFRELSTPGDGGEDSAAIRQRVVAAREIQLARFSKSSMTTNAAMSPRQMKAHCQLDSTSIGYIEHAMQELHFSARAHNRILKVARTLADLGGSESIRPDDVLEAIQFRSLDRKLFS